MEIYQKKKLGLIGYASAIAGNQQECALGPWHLYYSNELQNNKNFYWIEIIEGISNYHGLAVINDLIPLLKKLGELVIDCIHKKTAWCVLGGDHSSAIGVWSAVVYAMREYGDVGLIWIDAHMDSHTPKTSPSKNFHGMPLSHLLGYGEPLLRKLFDSKPKIKSENLCLIGLRSYEAEELAFLRKLNVKCFFMFDIYEKGIQSVLKEAIEHVSKNTIGFGISIDLDAFEPEDIPGVSCTAKGGINFHDFYNACLSNLKNCIGFEIVEYVPNKDKFNKTKNAIMKLLLLASNTVK